MPPRPAVVLPPLYAILDVASIERRGRAPLNVLASWLDDGVRLVQVRAKGLASGDMLSLIDRVLAMAGPAGALVVVNDRPDLARMAGAHGVHVGQDDVPPAQARAIVGPEAIVGLSTHTLAQVEAALREPVTYLAIGPVFATRSKPDHEAVVGIDGVRAAARVAAGAGLPLVAIGGITRAKAPHVLAAGAASVAMIGDLLETGPDPL
jgi:thiamine-phosphate pyrophosphorylase